MPITNPTDPRIVAEFALSPDYTDPASRVEDVVRACGAVIRGAIMTNPHADPDALPGVIADLREDLEGVVARSSSGQATEAAGALARLLISAILDERLPAYWGLKNSSKKA